MPRIFIISFFALIIKSGGICGQQAFNDSLLLYEYRYFTSTNAETKQLLLIKKVDLYLKNGITGSEALNEIRRVDLNAVKDTALKTKFLWNAALIAYTDHEDRLAALYLDGYSRLSGDTSVAFDLLQVLVHKFDDTVLVNSKIKRLQSTDSLFGSLHCFIETASYNRKHLNGYLLASALLPGSGSAMNGYALKGLVSLAFTAASVYGVVKLVEYGLYVNAVLWGGGVGLKFYAGNIKLTEELFYKAEARQKNKLAERCELKLKLILDKYQLILKAL